MKAINTPKKTVKRNNRLASAVEFVSNRYDAVLLFDVHAGSPNGDPDAGNQPRQMLSGHGIVTDVALKRKVRNFLHLNSNILVKQGAPLDETYLRAGANATKIKHGDPRVLLCDEFIDARMFGAVVTGKDKEGKDDTEKTDKRGPGRPPKGSKGTPGGMSKAIHGPIQFENAESVDPIDIEHMTITRCVAATKTEENKESGRMGQKSFIPYALYRSHIFVSPTHAHRPWDKDNADPAEHNAFRGTGMTRDDLDKFWEAVTYMFEMDRSASRGRMATQRLIVFEHPNTYGVCKAEDLFRRVEVKSNPKAKSFADYKVALDMKGLPKGMKAYEITMNGEGGIVKTALV